MADYTKIPILGIQNAGKSSLIRVLQREFKRLSELKPTKNIERTKLRFLDKEIIIWDFGGQERYRSSYKKKASTYFSDIEEAFYVLDIQDQSTIGESITFFQEIIAALKEYSPQSTVNLLMHKTDPGMETSEDLSKLFKAITDKFTELMHPLKMRISQTSIFNPLGVITAFSKPLFGNTTLYDNFSLIFKDFVSNSAVDFVIVFTDQLLEIGNFFSPEVDPQKMKIIAQEIFQAFDDKKLKLEKVTLQAGEEVLLITKFIAGNQKQNFYFTIGYNESIENPSQLIALSEALLDEVKKFMTFF